MEKRLVIFTGKEWDEYGMPAIIHYYVVLVKAYKQDNKYVVVTKIAISGGTPVKTEGIKLIGVIRDPLRSELAKKGKDTFIEASDAITNLLESVLAKYRITVK